MGSYGAKPNMVKAPSLRVKKIPQVKIFMEKTYFTDCKIDEEINKWIRKNTHFTVRWMDVRYNSGYGQWVAKVYYEVEILV